MVSVTETGSTPIPGEFFAAIAAVPYSTEEIARKQKSRDFYWYSPALSPIFDGLKADVVVTPRNEDDIVTTLKACYAFDVPLTVRGAGTGNYGQAVPMKGGVVLDLSGMTALKWVKPGLCRVEAGKKISDLDEELQAEGQELRLFPSAKRMARSSDGRFLRTERRRASGRGRVCAAQRLRKFCFRRFSSISPKCWG